MRYTLMRYAPVRYTPMRHTHEVHAHEMTPVHHRASGFCSTFCKVARDRCMILDNSWYDV
jgi:hypothetical protein